MGLIQLSFGTNNYYSSLIALYGIRLRYEIRLYLKFVETVLQRCTPMRLWLVGYERLVLSLNFQAV